MNMPSQNYIDMDLLLNEELWDQLNSSQPVHTPDPDFAPGIPVHRDFRNQNAMWRGSRNPGLHLTPHGSSAPATQHPFLYERGEFDFEQNPAFALAQQKTAGRQDVRNRNVVNAPLSSHHAAVGYGKLCPSSQAEQSVAIKASESALSGSHMLPSTQQPRNPSAESSQSATVAAGGLDNGIHGSPYPPGHPNWATNVRRQRSQSQTSRDRSRRSVSEVTVSSDLAHEGEEAGVLENDHGDEPETVPLSSMSIGDRDAKKLSEKWRKRRESHNAVERRRRDNINNQITECTYDLRRSFVFTQWPRSCLKICCWMRLRTSDPAYTPHRTSTQGGNSSSWTFGPDTAAKVARNRTGLGSWCSTTNEAVTFLPTKKGEVFIPEDSCLNMPSLSAFASALAPVSADSPALAAAHAKPNKGIILRKSVEYIRQMQQFLDIQMIRNNMLERELRQRYQPATGALHSLSTSCERPDRGPALPSQPGIVSWHVNTKQGQHLSQVSPPTSHALPNDPDRSKRESAPALHSPRSTLR